MDEARIADKIARDLMAKAKKGWYHFSVDGKVPSSMAALKRSDGAILVGSEKLYQHYLDKIATPYGVSDDYNFIHRLKIPVTFDEGKDRGSAFWHMVDKGWAWVYAKPSDFELVDGNVPRFEESGTYEPDMPEWVADDIDRYTDQHGRNLKPATVKWLQENMPSSAKTVYRGIGISKGEFRGGIPELNKILKKWTGISSVEELQRGAPVRMRKGKMSSWSTTPQTAKAFSISGIKLLVKAKAPAAKVILDFTEFSPQAKSKYRFRSQNEVVLSGAIDGKVASIVVDKPTAEWLMEHGYGVDRNGIYEL